MLGALAADKNNQRQIETNPMMLGLIGLTSMKEIEGNTGSEIEPSKHLWKQQTGCNQIIREMDEKLWMVDGGERWGQEGNTILVVSAPPLPPTTSPQPPYH